MAVDTEQKAQPASDPRDPVSWFEDWLRDAKEAGEVLPEAVSLATVSGAGRPSLRMVLLKGFSEGGFTIYTNLESRKATELAENQFASLCFHWKTLERQLRIEGIMEPVSDAEADAYFATRPRGSQIGAWASKQSSVLESRFALEKAVAKYVAKFGVSKVDRPDFWSGYRLIPDRMEFWQGRMSRLHDRDVFIRDEPGIDSPWRHERLYP